MPIQHKKAKSKLHCVTTKLNKNVIVAHQQQVTETVTSATITAFMVLNT